jgi:membrane fusion protein
MALTPKQDNAVLTRREVEAAASTPPVTNLPGENVHADMVGQSTPLFRPEVLAERQTPWLGSVMSTPMLSHHIIAAFAVLAALSVIALLYFGTYAREERLAGLLVPQRGIVRVFPPQPGVISEIKVKEGDAVKRGAALFTLSGETQSSAVGATQAEAVRNLKSQLGTIDDEAGKKRDLLRQQRRSLASRIDALKSEEAQLQQEIALQQSRVALADKSVDRQNQLLQKGFISEQSLQLSQETTVEQAGKLRGLMRNRMAIIRDRIELEGLLNDLPMKAFSEIAALNRTKSQVSQEIAQAEVRREIVIPAPEDGTVTAIQGERGGPANVGSALLSIVPSGADLEAHLFAPSRAIGFLRAGQSVFLRYQAFPYQKFGHHVGTIESISRATLNANEVPTRVGTGASVVGNNEPLYRVTVKVLKKSMMANGEEIALQPGMQLDADVVLEQRRLFEWMLEPIYSLTGKWRSGADNKS